MVKSDSLIHRRKAVVAWRDLFLQDEKHVIKTLPLEIVDFFINQGPTDDPDDIVRAGAYEVLELILRVAAARSYLKERVPGRFETIAMVLDGLSVGLGLKQNVFRESCMECHFFAAKCLETLLTRDREVCREVWDDASGQDFQVLVSSLKTLASGPPRPNSRHRSLQSVLWNCFDALVSSSYGQEEKSAAEKAAAAKKRRTLLDIATWAVEFVPAEEIFQCLASLARDRETVLSIIKDPYTSDSAANPYKSSFLEFYMLLMIPTQQSTPKSALSYASRAQNLLAFLTNISLLVDGKKAIVEVSERVASRPVDLPYRNPLFIEIPLAALQFFGPDTPNRQDVNLHAVQNSCLLIAFLCDESKMRAAFARHDVVLQELRKTASKAQTLQGLQKDAAAAVDQIVWTP
eukprot:ANDGO_05189.mRNA.2 hypothetical protein